MDEAALIAEIVEHPELEEPKLVYADWLEERGDGRAEFLRLQCELNCFDFHETAVKDLKEDLIAFWESADKEWLGKVATKYDVWILNEEIQRLAVAKALQMMAQLTLAAGLLPFKKGQGPSRLAADLDLIAAEKLGAVLQSAGRMFAGRKSENQPFLIIPNWREPPTPKSG